MKREAHLKFCSICSKQKIVSKYGIVCGITDLPADFEISCDNFQEDLALKKLYEMKLWENEIHKKTAKIGKRIANYILDLIFFYIFCYILGIFLGILLPIFSPESIYYLSEAEDDRLLNFLFGIVIYILYYSLLEGLTGRTLAKIITRTKVVDKDGEKPDFKKIMIRTITRLIPFEWISFMGEGTGWHDTWSKTVVVDESLGKRENVAQKFI